jgi:outer membrane lipoprotein
MNTKFLLTAVATLALSACATAPKPLQGQFSLVSPRDSVATQQVGTPVRWGGRIIETKPGRARPASR